MISNKDGNDNSNNDSGEGRVGKVLQSCLAYYFTQICFDFILPRKHIKDN